MITTLQYKLVKIRKPHTCFLCYRKFEVNERMYYWVCVDSGQMNSGYYCKTCDEIINLLPSYETQEIEDGYVDNCLDKDQTPEQYLDQLKAEKLKQ